MAEQYTVKYDQAIWQNNIKLSMAEQYTDKHDQAISYCLSIEQS